MFTSYLLLQSFMQVLLDLYSPEVRLVAFLPLKLDGYVSTPQQHIYY
jgi:hypothetical protein